MALSQEAINQYMMDYYSLVIEDPVKKDELIKKTQAIIQDNSEELVFINNTGLHKYLDAILYNHLHSIMDRPPPEMALDELIDIKPMEPLGGDDEIDWVKGEALSEQLSQNLSEKDFLSFVDLIGNMDDFQYVLSQTGLTINDIQQMKGLSEQISQFTNLPKKSIQLRVDHILFQSGSILYNPVKVIDDATMPIIREVIEDIHDKDITSIRQEFVNRKFTSLIKKEKGITNIIRRVTPDLVEDLVYRGIWQQGEESDKRAIKQIENVLYNLHGYEQAEKTANRNDQIEIINELIQQPRLFDYFREHNLRNILSALFDSTGEHGLTKRDSPRALLEFYDKKKNLNWFDRTQEIYVPRWKITERGMWQQGKESIQLAVESIEDILFIQDGFRTALESGDRTTQLKLIDDIIKGDGLLTYFRTNARGMLGSNLGGRKEPDSVRALFELYCYHTKSDWFNQNKVPHMAIEGHNNVKIKYHAGELSRKKKIPVIDFDNHTLKKMEVVLYRIPGYQKAEEKENRGEQVRILNELIKNNMLNLHFRQNGLKWTLDNFYDYFKNQGFTEGNSTKALLELYDRKKNLNWFDITQEIYIHKWKRDTANTWQSKEESVKLDIKAIENALYVISDYKEAEKTNNRKEQVRIINEFMKHNNLTNHFETNNLGWLLNRFNDFYGNQGFTKKSSTRALLEFYDREKELNWFDRTQKIHIPNWKKYAADMWQSKDDSVKLALEAIEDALYVLPDFKEAEKTNNRKEQVRIINNLAKEHKLRYHFDDNDLGSIWANFHDATGQYGLTNKTSLRSLIEFYSDKKDLNWFDRTLDEYVQGWRITTRGQGRKWKKGEESVELALQAIQDALFTLRGYREAEKTGNRGEQVRILNNFIENTSNMGKYFNEFGLGGLFRGFSDPNGEFGLKKKNSARYLLEFYDNKKGLNWFDRTQETYIHRWKFPHKGKWQQGQESLELATEAIEDILFLEKGLRKSYEENDRYQTLKIIDNIINREGLRKYFEKHAKSVLQTKLGGKKTDSVSSLFKFFSDYKSLGWWDTNMYPHFAIKSGAHRSIKIVYDKAA